MIRTNLNGLFGRQSGTASGYSYSVDNRNLAVTWDEKTVYDFLLNPMKFVGTCRIPIGFYISHFKALSPFPLPRISVTSLENAWYDRIREAFVYAEHERFRECLFLPGTNKKDKIFPGVKTPQERADLIAYLKKSTAS